MTNITKFPVPGFSIFLGVFVAYLSQLQTEIWFKISNQI